MSRKIIAIIGYIVIALLGAIMIAFGAVTIGEQTISSVVIMFLGVVLMMIGIRGPIQFLKQEKQSEDRFLK